MMSRWPPLRQIHHQIRYAFSPCGPSTSSTTSTSPLSYANLLESAHSALTSCYATFTSTSESEAIAPLQFLPFRNNQSSFTALVDPGSQLNIVSHSLLPFLTFTPYATAAPALRGVSGKCRSITQWIRLPVQLDNNTTADAICAVVTDLPCLVLFGLPFLSRIHAIHHIPGKFLATPQGPLPLTVCPTTRPQSCTTTAALDETLAGLDNPDLTEDQKQATRQLLEEFQELWRGGRRGQALEIAHKINLTHHRPIVSRPRPISAAQQQVVQAEIQKMLEDGAIRPSDSPYASEIVLVLKKTNDWRVCIDYRLLNKATVPDKYPLPRISELVHAVKGSRYFVALDLRAGYWQIPMDTTSIKYTAFRCFLGLYEFLVMPFGLTNAPATFQRGMDFLFNDLRFQGVLCYMDDILVHSSAFSTTLGLLRRVLERLRSAGLTINLPKSLFFPRTLKYLGAIIEEGRLRPDPKKVGDLEHMKEPETVHDVRSLLGFLGYYHSYVPRFAAIMEPVFSLLKAQKNTKHANAVTKITWTDEHRHAIDQVRNILSQAVLEIPIDGDEFLVETDASDTAIAGILSTLRNTEWQPVEFFSKVLSATQKNWPVREREAFAIVAALQKFDHYIRGRAATVHTDHESLKWMLVSPKGKIARWSSLLAEYALQIFYKRGKELQHVDFLTRSLDAEPDGTVLSRMCYFTARVDDLPSLEDILQAQRAELRQTTKGFIEKNQVTYYHGLIWVPHKFQTAVIAACHSLPPFHHPGIKKTKKIIMRTFNWPYLHAHVSKYLQSCLHCRRARSGQERLQSLQRAHPIPEAFDSVYLDFWEVNYAGKHYKVFTLIDAFTKWPEAVPILDATAVTIASTFLRSWAYRYGVPRRIVSDRDKSFVNQLVDSLISRLGITHITSTAYHPEGNAFIESFHQTLNTHFRFINQASMPFEEALDMSLCAYRATPHHSTGHSPSFLVFGQDPRLATDVDWRMEAVPIDQERLKFLSALRLDVQLQSQLQAISLNVKRNEDRQPVEFTEHQLVLCRHLPLDRLKYKTAFYKAIPRWTTPYRVLKVLPSRKTAVVKCLLTNSTRQVHIQDVRFIEQPDGEVQHKEWEKIISEEAVNIYQPGVAQEVIRRFFTRLAEPQLGEPASMAPLSSSRTAGPANVTSDTLGESRSQKKRPRTS